jgi:hypothetical protein
MLCFSSLRITLVQVDLLERWCLSNPESHVKARFVLPTSPQVTAHQHWDTPAFSTGSAGNLQAWHPACIHSCKRGLCVLRGAVAEGGWAPVYHQRPMALSAIQTHWGQAAQPSFSGVA